jgi:CubicO group peptidase (beta-lactamase class C family)
MKRGRSVCGVTRGVAAGRLWRALLPIVVCLLCARSAHSLDRVDAFVASLDERVPALLLRYGVPSAVVSVVHGGRTTTRSWGVADIVTGRMPSDTTLYNVASITKVVTAWGVMRLVEEGKVDLDAPISQYVSRFELPPASENDAVTVRRLLSHTSGLSMSAVPSYGPGQAVPSLAEMLSDSKDPLRLIDSPGAAYHYSGGGYALLQLLIEEVTGEKYEAFITRTIFGPLGMTHSTFHVPASNVDAATPYDESLRPEPHYRFAASAAAGLYATAADLARFAVASTSSAAEAGVLRGSTVAAMQQQRQSEKKDPFGHGLGYSLVPLPAGGHLVGHSGSNEGWTVIWDVIPSTGDGLVILLNRSEGFPVYRELLCDWVDAASGGRWPGFCDETMIAWTPDHTAFVDSLFASATLADPATAVLVANATGVVYRKAFGSRDVRAGTVATPETPFYIASLAKSLTAIVALQLVAEGRWTLSDPVGKFLPDLPQYVRQATLDQLLSHTSGVPNYQDLIDWKRYDGMDNSKAIALLGTQGVLKFPSGSRYAYSNTGYVLVASAIERLTKRAYRDVLGGRVLNPLGMCSTLVDDGNIPAPEGRAIGYERQGGNLVPSDYHTVTVDGREFPLRSSTFGAGGMYSTVDDLYALDRALHTDRLLPLPLQTMAMTPRTKVMTELDIPVTTGHGYGWFVARRGGRNLVWNSGDFAGHHTAILRAPDQKFVVIVLSSASERNASAIARTIVDRAFAWEQ